MKPHDSQGTLGGPQWDSDECVSLPLSQRACSPPVRLLWPPMDQVLIWQDGANCHAHCIQSALAFAAGDTLEQVVASRLGGFLSRGKRPFVSRFSSRDQVTELSRPLDPTGFSPGVQRANTCCARVKPPIQSCTMKAEGLAQQCRLVNG